MDDNISLIKRIRKVTEAIASAPGEEKKRLEAELDMLHFRLERQTPEYEVVWPNEGPEK
jgi:hypothetical protein